MLATQVSSTANFLMAESWVFGSGSSRAGRAWRYIAFMGMNNAALGSARADDVGAHVAAGLPLHALQLHVARRDDAHPLRVSPTPSSGGHPPATTSLRTRSRPHRARFDPSRLDVCGQRRPQPDGRRRRSPWSCASAQQCFAWCISTRSGSTATRPCTRDKARRCSGSATPPTTSRCSGPTPCFCSPSWAPRSGSSGRATSQLAPGRGGPVRPGFCASDVLHRPDHRRRGGRSPRRRDLRAAPVPRDRVAASAGRHGDGLLRGALALLVLRWMRTLSNAALIGAFAAAGSPRSRRKSPCSVPVLYYAVWREGRGRSLRRTRHSVGDRGLSADRASVSADPADQPVSQRLVVLPVAIQPRAEPRSRLVRPGAAAVRDTAGPHPRRRRHRRTRW